jgi:hypothetical protein
VINAHLAADLVVEGEKCPVFVWTVDHPAGRVLVDTGLIDSRPEIEDMSPAPHAENIPRDVALVINTTCISTTAAATASSRAYRPTCSHASSQTPAPSPTWHRP